MKKRLYLFMTMLIGSFALIFSPVSKVLHAEESVEETTSEEVEQNVFIFDDDNGSYYEFTINNETEIYVYVNDHNGNELRITTSYVKADKVYYLPEIDLGFIVEENGKARLIPSYIPVEKVDDEIIAEENKSFFETLWGKILSYIMAIGGGSLLSALLTFVFNLANKKAKEKQDDTLNSLLDKAGNLFKIIGNVVATSNEEKETLNKLYKDTCLFLNEVKNTLESQKTDIEKINALSVKFNALLSVVSKTVSVNPEYLNIAEDINKLIDKELGN